ncbi:MAG: hypothetical protein PF904_03780 [Kiritimatiellae bacterium]|jgi:hypothetical protein|nr:hypothetical protein [Kiritimatiellia bacterium]
MKPEVLSTITSLAGVVLGFLLSTVYQLIQSLSKRKNAKKTLRHLIQLEISSNVSALEIFWSQIVERKKEWVSEEGEIVEFRLGQIIADLPFPRIGANIWHSNAEALPSAYSTSSIEKLWDIYQDLLLLSDLHGHFCITDSEVTDASRHRNIMTGLPDYYSGYRFSIKSGNYVSVFKYKIESLIDSFHVNKLLPPE